MKNVMYALLGGCLWAACSTPSSSEFTMSGTLSGVESDTVLVRSWAVDYGRDNQDIRLDAVGLQDGKFTYQSKDSVMRFVSVFAQPVPDADGRIKAISMRRLTLPLMSGRTVTLSGSLDNCTIGGDEFYQAMGEVEAKAAVYQAKIDSLGTVVAKLSEAKVPEDSISKVLGQARNWGDEMDNVRLDYATQHPDSELSVFYLSQISSRKIGDALAALTPEVKAGVMAPLCKQLEERYAKTMALEKAKEAVKEGAVAPEFTLKDLEGKEFKLSSLRGKYVVLDFWGSWCGWCIKGMPDMKKTYAKYKGKMEFVGIDCNDTEEKWKAAVEQHQLPWIHVRNEGNPDVSVMYAVTGYPTKYIIDPEGKIVKQVIGEDPAFYTFVDELMKK